MSTRVKLSRKQLIKGPDQFLTASDKVLEFCRKNRVLVMSVAAGLIFLLCALWVYRYNRQVEVVRMESLLFEMKQKLQEDFDKNPERAIADLNGKVEKLVPGRHKQRAKLILADAYYRSRQFEKSGQLYSEVAGATDADDLYHDLAQLGLAYSHEAGKNFKKAIDLLKSIMEHETSLPLFTIYLDLVRCYELDNDPKNALLALREMKSKFPGNPDMGKVDRWIEKLDGRA
ncbi:MAG: tetratricopeptide repeat protein [Nitrospinae bacterium]|nr:tetratricopeptide repeat protein [Nitrospinota bacterium]